MAASEAGKTFFPEIVIFLKNIAFQDGEEEILNWQSEVKTVQGRTKPSHGLVYDVVEVCGPSVFPNYILTCIVAEEVVSCVGIVILPVFHRLVELFLSPFSIMYRDQQGIQSGSSSVELGDLVHAKWSECRQVRSLLVNFFTHFVLI